MREVTRKKGQWEKKTGRKFHHISARTRWCSWKNRGDFCNIVRVVITFAAKKQNISLYSCSETCPLQSKGDVLSELLSGGLTGFPSLTVLWQWNKLCYMHFCSKETRRGSGLILNKCKKCIMHILVCCKTDIYSSPFPHCHKKIIA